MAHLNQNPNPNLRWSLDFVLDNATRERRMWLTLQHFGVCVHYDVFDRHAEAKLMPTKEQLLMLAEYLWRPQGEVRISLTMAVETIKYLEDTQDVQLAQPV